MTCLKHGCEVGHKCVTTWAGNASTRLFSAWSPGFDGVVPEQPPDNRLTTTAQRSSLDDDPLGMGSRIVISELGNLALRSVHQPTNTILWWVPFKLWTILIRHPEIIQMNLCIAR